jgi:hypothetical protein
MRWRAVACLPSQSNRPACGHRTPKPRLWPPRLRLARLLPAKSSRCGERDRVAPSVPKAAALSRGHSIHVVTRLVTEQERG